MVTSTTPTTTTWEIDSSHAVAEFAAKHLMVSTVKGRFGHVEGTLTIDEERPENSEVFVSIDAASVDTREPKRDEHLRSDDFFAVEKYPRITFRSTRIDPVGGAAWKVQGDLTIRGVTRPVVLDAEYEGEIQDPWGSTRRGFTAETRVNRKDFGLNWNMMLEAGGVLVGDNVKLSLGFEAVRRS
jgi:polyisoprenoid-binding protein YceI